MLKNILSDNSMRPLMLITFLGYFTFWWLYRLDMLPGLHGDEAWVGLKAEQIRRSGIDRLSGMTYYTGILQSMLSALSFNLLDLGVLQLRLPGAVLNLISVGIIIFCFLRQNAFKEATLFLLLVASSALLLISPRVAWEVNSLTLFFLALSLMVLSELYTSEKRLHPVLFSLYITVNILGTYNHIIYSCVSLSAFCGAILWINFHKIRDCNNLLALLFITAINAGLSFLLMRYFLDFVYHNILWLPAVYAAYVAWQYQWYLGLSDKTINYMKLVPKAVIPYIFISCVICFGYFHGIAFFEVISAYKIVLQAYGYESSQLFKVGFVVCASILILYAGWCIITDFSSPERSAPAFIILSYLGLFSLYTQRGSYRYYLALCAIMFLYLSYSLIKQKYSLKPILVSQIVMLGLLNAQLLDVFVNYPVLIRATNFEIGNNQKETSAHFLPKGPLVEYLKKNHIGRVDYLTDPYFLSYPIRFYQLIAPWHQLPGNRATIDYEYRRYGNGFYLYKEN